MTQNILIRYFEEFRNIWLDDIWHDDIWYDDAAQGEVLVLA